MFLQFASFIFCSKIAFSSLLNLNCRVSTDDKGQLNRYKSQMEHYINYIKKNKEWDLAGIYADDSLSKHLK